MERNTWLNELRDLIDTCTIQNISHVAECIRDAGTQLGRGVVAPLLVALDKKRSELESATERRHVLKYTPVETVKTDFNMVDQQGRKIGHRADIVKVDTRLVESDATSCHLIPKNMPMTFYEVRTHATRNGEMYGAGQGPNQKCASFPEALSVAHAKAASSLKSYERRFIKNNAKKVTT